MTSCVFRHAVLTLAVLALPVALAAQTVSTIRLSEAVSFDGLYMAADGTLYGASGHRGDRVVTIGRDGRIELFASGFDGPIDMSEDGQGRLYVTAYNNGTLGRARLGADPHILASNLDRPSGVARGPDGAFYVATWGDPSPGTIYRVTPDGEVSVFVEGQGIGITQPMAFDDTGYLYVGSPMSGTIHRVSPAGAVVPFVELAGVRAVEDPFIGDIVHHGGVLYVTVITERKVLRVDIQTREVTVLAGSGEQATRDGVGEEAAFGFPWGLAISRDGRELWVSVPGLTYDRIRKIDLGPRPGQTPADVAGEWTLTVDTDRGTETARVVLEQNRGGLTGDYSSDWADEVDVTGSVNEDEIELSFRQVAPLLMDVTYTGTLQDDGTLSGQVSFGTLGEGTFTGTRR